MRVDSHMKMTIESWKRANLDKFGSDFELFFVENVLPAIRGLDYSCLFAQYPFLDSDGRQRYCDFAIIESDNVRVAIEVDGYDKRGTGTGMSHADFIDWQRRQASLAAQGWHVLRFANKDVRDHPSRCAEPINALLDKLRNQQSGRVQIITIPVAAPMASRDVVTVSEKPLLAASELRAPGSISKSFKRGAMLVVVLALLGAVLLPALRQTGPADGAEARVHPPAPVGPASQQFSATGYEFDGNWGWGKLRCSDALSWREASKHVGELVTVQGPLFSSKFMAHITGKPTWMDVGNKFPSTDRLQLIVWGSNRGNFDLPHIDEEGFDMERYEGRLVTVCAQGKVAMYKGVPQIELKDMSQVRIVNQ